jgi:membrane protease YdiL (CAAX protease family)
MPAVPRGIGVGIALGAWVAATLVGTTLGGVVLLAAGFDSGATGPVPTRFVVASAVALWTANFAALVFVSRRFGTSSFARDYAWRFRPSDAWGIPLGVACQFVLVNVVMLPLRVLFPDTFGVEQVERRARDLYDAATGGWLIALALVVVVGAPVVEELVYRGLVQGSLVARFGVRVGVVLAAAWFTVAHLSPSEFPGLFAFALVLGWARLRSGRLGLPVVTHVAFNAAGLLAVALT